MSRFIKTTSGYINQDHILLIRFATIKGEEGEDLITMSDGRIVQTQIEDFDWLAPELRPGAREAHGLLGPTHAADEQNRRRTMAAATEPKDRSMAMVAAAEPEGQKEAPAGSVTGGGEGSDAVPEPL